LPAFRQGKKVLALLQSRLLRSRALVPVVTGSVGPLPVFTKSSIWTILADVLVQSPVIEESECPTPTSIPSSVPAVETMLSRAVGQLTPFPAHVLAQTSVSDILACLAPTSRKDSDNVPSDVPSRTTLGVYPVELGPGAKWDPRPSFRWSQAKTRVCRDSYHVMGPCFLRK